MLSQFIIYTVFPYIICDATLLHLSRKTCFSVTQQSKFGHANETVLKYKINTPGTSPLQYAKIKNIVPKNKRGGVGGII